MQQDRDCHYAALCVQSRVGADSPCIWGEHNQTCPALPAVLGSLCMTLPEVFPQTSLFPLPPSNNPFPVLSTVRTYSLQMLKQNQKQLQTQTQPTNLLLLPWRTIRKHRLWAQAFGSQERNHPKVTLWPLKEEKVASSQGRCKRFLQPRCRGY